MLQGDPEPKASAIVKGVQATHFVQLVLFAAVHLLPV
jgi:hypothetical protein